MGKITEAKKVYDQLAADYFSSKGWSSFIIDVTGKTVADVVAIQRKQVAVVEVKGICEESCSATWDDTRNTAAGLDPKVVNYLRTARKNVAAHFPNRTQKIERFYAISVACQLFRYFSEFDLVLPAYSRKIDATTISKMGACRKIPYFIVPIEQSTRADCAMNGLVSGGYLKSYSIGKTSRIYIMKIEYNPL
jgi:hypothetical protein